VSLKPRPRTLIWYAYFINHTGDESEKEVDEQDLDEEFADLLSASKEDRR
jgi:hypothetical protein